MKNTFVNIITTFFTLIVLFPTIINLHSLEHLLDDEPSDHCEYCEILGNQNQLDLSIGSGGLYSDNQLHIIPNTLEQLFLYNISQDKIVSPDFVHNKPPPILQQRSFFI